MKKDYEKLQKKGSGNQHQELLGKVENKFFYFPLKLFNILVRRKGEIMG